MILIYQVNLPIKKLGGNISKGKKYVFLNFFGYLFVLFTASITFCIGLFEFANRFRILPDYFGPVFGINKGKKRYVP